MTYSILIPVHNEEGRIGKCLEELSLRFPEAEIVVSEDGSTDRTVEVAMGSTAKIISSNHRLGKLGGIKAGIEYLRCSRNIREFVIVTDVDLSIDPLYFLLALESLRNGADVVLGSRMRRKDSLTRRVLSLGFHFLVKCLTGLDIDSQTGFVASRIEYMELFFDGIPTRAGYAYSVMFWANVKYSGARVLPIPVQCENSSGSSMRLCRDVPRMLFDLLKISWIIRTHSPDVNIFHFREKEVLGKTEAL